MKRLAAITFAMVSSFAILAPSTAMAEFWANATVNSILQTETYVSVRLTEENNTFQNKLFRLNNDRQNAMLAILLSAAALNKPVRVYFEDTSPANILITGMTGLDN